MGYDERAEQTPLMQFGGLNTRDGELNLPVGDSPYLVNMDLHPNGSIKQRKGMTLIGYPLTHKKIDAIMRLEQPEAETGWIYVVANATIYRTPYPGTIAWTVPDTIPTGYSMTKVFSTTAWGRANGRFFNGTTEYPSVLYIPRSNNPPLIALGQTAVAGDLVVMPAGVIGAVAPATPVTGVSGYPGPSGYDDSHPQWKTNHWPTTMRMVSVGHGARMLAWGFPDDRNAVAYSAMDDPHNFIRSNVEDYSLEAQPNVDGGFYRVNPGDGDEIVTVVDMFSYTVIFKKHSTYIYTGDPGYINEWTMRAQFPVGCVSDRAWTRVGNDIYFWSKDGPRALSAVQEYGDLAQSNLSFKVSDLVRAIMPQSFRLICCYHDITNMRVVWFVPLTGSTYNDAGYAYYYESKKWAKFSGKYCNMMDVLLVSSTGSQAEQIVGGSYDEGMVVLQSGLSDLGDDIATDYYTNWIQFGSVSDGTRALWLDVFYGDGGSGCEIQYQTDLNPDWTDVSRIIKTFGGGGAAWTRFAWGDAAWGDTARAHMRYEINAIFDMIRLRFKKTGTAGFETMGYRLEARRKGSRT